MTHTNIEGLSVDDLAQEIRSLAWREMGAGLLAEKLMPFFERVISRRAANSAGGVEVKGMPISTAPRDGTYILARQEGVLEPSFYVVAFDQSWGDNGWWMTCDGKDPELPLRGPEPAEWWPLPVSTLAVAAEPVAWLCNGMGSGWIERDKITFDREAAEHMAAQEVWTVVPLYTHPSSPISAEVTEAMVERLARFIAQDIFGNSWDGQGAEGRCTDRGFKPFHFSMHGGMRCQGTQNDLRDVARSALAALNWGRENG